MISLLSPAKNMDFTKGPIESSNNEPMFLDNANYLANKMKKLSSRQIAKLMNLSPALSDLNVNRLKKWNNSSNEKREAIYAFNGEVYRGLNAHNFSNDELDFAQAHLLMLSGLYGLLKPLDLIQPYRLEMGSKLKVTPSINTLYNYWGNRLSNQLNELLNKQESKFILNLASNEYVKAIDKKVLSAPLIEFEFLDWKNGKYQSIMTWAKNARGSMANQIIVGKVDDFEGLKSIAFNGYEFNHDLSSDSNFVYTRKVV